MKDDNFQPNRSLHTRAVALFMKNHAVQYGLDPDEAAILGWLHDVGYFFGDNSSHAVKGGEMLRAQGYKYWREVMYHGTPDGLGTKMGLLLNIADMSIDSQGREVGFARRIEDITSRYGSDSNQANDSRNMIELILRDTE